MTPERHDASLDARGEGNFPLQIYAVWSLAAAGNGLGVPCDGEEGFELGVDGFYVGLFFCGVGEGPVYDAVRFVLGVEVRSHFVCASQACWFPAHLPTSGPYASQGRR